MKTNKNQIRKFLVLLLVSQLINTTLFIGLKVSADSLGEYIYSITAKNFLAQAPTVHKGLATGVTINKLKK